MVYAKPENPSIYVQRIQTKNNIKRIPNNEEKQINLIQDMYSPTQNINFEKKQIKAHRSLKDRAGRR